MSLKLGVATIVSISGVAAAIWLRQIGAKLIVN
jgi:hypothetical protein